MKALLLFPIILLTPLPVAAADTLPSLPPPAPIREVRETYFGTVVVDP
jgi:hypothetical protein